MVEQTLEQRFVEPMSQRLMATGPMTRIRSMRSSPLDVEVDGLDYLPDVDYLLFWGDSFLQGDMKDKNRR